MSFPMLYEILRGMATTMSRHIDGNGGVFYRHYSRQVYVASCIDPTINDCTLTAVIDVVPIRQITETYGLEKV